MAGNILGTRVGIIMAGGWGERCWPLSRRGRPKQLLCLVNKDSSLLDDAIRHVAPLIPAERLFLVTSGDLQETIRLAKTDVLDENVLAEPCKRNTVGCLVYAVAHLLCRFGEDASQLTLAIFTADHFIGEEAHWRLVVERAMTVAEQEGSLVCVGVRPTRPDTGYGYIEIPSNPDWDSANAASISALPVVRFREKPSREAAEDFLATGRFLWNSGMLFCTLATFMEELEAAQPILGTIARNLASALRDEDDARAAQLFEEIEDTSIDYAVLEHAQRLLVIPASFRWDDIGAWSSLDRIHPHDPQGNVVVGDPILVDTANSIVYNEVGADEMAVMAVGVQDLVIVVTRDGVLVVPKEHAQDVRHGITKLKERGGKHL